MVREAVREAREEPAHAATAIQAAFQGLAARRWVREAVLEAAEARSSLEQQTLTLEALQAELPRLKPRVASRARARLRVPASSRICFVARLWQLLARSLAVEKRYAFLTFFLEDMLQLAVQIYVVRYTKSFNTVTAFTLGGTMVGALMAAYRASKLAAYAIL